MLESISPDAPGSSVEADKELRYAALQTQPGQVREQPLQLVEPGNPMGERPSDTEAGHEWKHARYDEATGGIATSALRHNASVEPLQPSVRPEQQ